MENKQMLKAMAHVALLLDTVDMVRLFTARDRLQSQFSKKTRTAASQPYVKPQLAFREYVSSNLHLLLPFGKIITMIIICCTVQTILYTCTPLILTSTYLCATCLLPLYRGDTQNSCAHIPCTHTHTAPFPHDQDPLYRAPSYRY